MQIRSGSLLVAHPKYSDREHSQHVVYITESTGTSTMGLKLNESSHYDMYDLMFNKGVIWQGDRELYLGGDINPNSLVMLHTNEWYSANTMQVDNYFAISSDYVMIDKMSEHNTPDWYRLFLGCLGWSPRELESELRTARPKWLLLSKPSQVLIESDYNHMWDLALEEYSQDVFSNYI